MKHLLQSITDARDTLDLPATQRNLVAAGSIFTTLSKSTAPGRLRTRPPRAVAGKAVTKIPPKDPFPGAGGHEVPESVVTSRRRLLPVRHRGLSDQYKNGPLIESGKVLY